MKQRMYNSVSLLGMGVLSHVSKNSMSGNRNETARVAASTTSNSLRTAIGKDKKMKPKLQVSQQGYVCSYYCRAWSDVYVPVAYPNVSPTRMSSSLQIAELEHPDQPDSPELAVGQGHGYLWRLNNYWWLEEKDGCRTALKSKNFPLCFQHFLGF